MKINREILMTIVKNSSNRLEGEQEIIEINEKQLHIISKELNKLFSLYGVSNCNDKKGSEFQDWLKKQNLKEVVTKEYKWREFVLDEEFVLAKFNEDKHS